MFKAYVEGLCYTCSSISTQTFRKSLGHNRTVADTYPRTKRPTATEVAAPQPRRSSAIPSATRVPTTPPSPTPGALPPVAQRGASPGDTHASQLSAVVAATTSYLRATLENLVTGISMLETAPRPLDSGIEQRSLRYMAGEAERISQTLATLDEVCAVLSPTPALRAASIEIGDLLMELLAAWKQRAPHHTLELALPGEVPTIIGDEARINRALDLLLEFAIALAPDGGTVRVSVRPHADALVVSLRQPDSTLDPTQLSQLCEPFRSVPLGAQTLIGAGLGLALARANVEAHGGRMWTETASSGRGISLLASFPLTPAAPAVEVAPALAEQAPTAVTEPTRVAVERGRRVVLVLEGDQRMARFLRANLEAQQYRAISASDTAEALHLIDLEEPDLLLLDDSLGGAGGSAPLAELRAYTSAPIIILARRSDPIECARLLDAGAADYIARPISVEELSARVRAALRTSEVASRTAAGAPVFTTGELTIDLGQHLVTVAGQSVPLSKTEYKLLRVLAQHAGMVLSHEVVLERVWGPAYSREVEFVWVYIRRLRRKIEPDPSHPRYILTVPGVGYRLARC